MELEYESEAVLQIRSEIQVVHNTDSSSDTKFTEPMFPPDPADAVHRCDTEVKGATESALNLDGHEVGGVLECALAQSGASAEVGVEAGLDINSEA